MPSSTIAIIGAGNIGGTLARRWVAAGHRVILGVRDPAGSRASGLVAELGWQCSAAPVGEAVSAGDVVVFAVPGSAMPSLTAGLRSALRGRIVIDATNRLGDAGPANSLDLIMKACPTAAAYRAFNAFGWEILADPVVEGAVVDLFFAGPDGAGRAAVAGLIEDVGLRPIWVGGPERADLVDALAALWFALVLDRSKGHRMAFKLLGA